MRHSSNQCALSLFSAFFRGEAEHFVRWDYGSPIRVFVMAPPYPPWSCPVQLERYIGTQSGRKCRERRPAGANTDPYTQSPEQFRSAPNLQSPRNQTLRSQTSPTLKAHLAFLKHVPLGVLPLPQGSYQNILSNHTAYYLRKLQEREFFLFHYISYDFYSPLQIAASGD